MKLLVCEYFSSGMGERGALSEDGFAMLDALLRDFGRMPDLEISTILGEAHRGRRGAGDGEFREALEACDCVLIVAPETGGALARLTDMAERVGKRVLGSSAAAVAAAGNKAAALRLLEANGLPVPPWAVLRRGETPAGFSFPFVVKPTRGAGGEGVRLIRSTRQWQSWRAWRACVDGEEPDAFLAQAWIPGEAVSVSCLVGERGVRPLSLNRQHIAAGDEPRFLGITVPYRHPLEDAAAEIAARACSLVPGLRGFVGVDLMMGPDGPVLLEINPRLTFAYVALRRAVAQNLALELLTPGDGKLEVRGSHTVMCGVKPEA